MRGLLDRLEALERRLVKNELSPAESAALSADIDRVLGLAPPGADLDRFYRETLARLDSGLATDMELAAVGGCNIEIMRIVSRLEGSC